MLTVSFWMAEKNVQGANVPPTTLDAHWTRFKTEQGQVYQTATEDAKRKRLFATTNDLITAHNSNPQKTYTMEHNKFSVMTEEEKNGYKGRVVPANFTRWNMPMVVSHANTRTLSKSVDLRKDPCMQPIRDQAGCGCCWAFGASATLEFTTCVRTCTPVALSPQQLVDCDTGNGNNACQGGMGFDSWSYVAKVGGQNTWSSYPYTSGSTGTAGTCKFNAANVAAKVNKVTPFRMIANKDVTTMMTIIDNRGVVDVGFSVANDFYSYKSGVFTGKLCGTSGQNHEMVAVGYGTDSATGLDYWIIRNQWGTSQGIDGYYLIQRGVNLCRIEELAAIVILP